MVTIEKVELLLVEGVIRKQIVKIEKTLNPQNSTLVFVFQSPKIFPLQYLDSP